MPIRVNGDQVWNNSRYISLSNEIPQIYENYCINEVIITYNNTEKKVDNIEVEVLGMNIRNNKENLSVVKDNDGLMSPMVNLNLNKEGTHNNNEVGKHGMIGRKRKE